ncbi:hypothetical protein FNV43_RR20874 [Rhamnella rubrinervis]|uniref:Myb-like domain-containing protein n=1 Tax=Rhamnella rubrinervis TaxID=2594499 RepID=A0A8K0GUY9_9ROSA|nr:hypothetical protein FNV43_RR20874 [Rhamnella rubrinervis]
MVQKRPYDDEEIFMISFKHPRQVEHNKQLISFSESVFPEDASGIRQTVDNGFKNADIGDVEKLSGDIFTDPPKGGEDVETSAPGGCSISSWPTSCTSEEDSLSESPFHVPSFPDYFNPERPIRTLVHFEDMYSLLLSNPPRKSVPIGSNHQADVPEWGLQGTNDVSNQLDTSEVVSNSDNEEKRLMGVCVCPMPDWTLSDYIDGEVGNGRTDCSCEDKGSVRCVRQHISEARDKLVKTIGQERFMELGFYEMGEQVAHRWSEDEEQVFNEVVFSNPASLGKNFWQNLSDVFPSRSRREIVSYYFNVFMLRRRAEQNRSYPINIDSDNDEWQGSDVFCDNELGISDEDDDSVVESPIYEDDAGNNHSWEGFREYDEDVADDACNENVNLEYFGRGINQISETCPGKFLNNFGSSPVVQPQDKITWDDKGDQEVQDDSCTSFDTGAASLGNHVKSENDNHCPGSFNGLSNGGNHGYVLDHCDAKVWEVGYITCPKSKVDFLPTSNMIEEVFGEDSRNHKVRDGKNLS